ncbi:MAG: type II toxin-antitoxin system VapC family toxin [Thermoguttaceae bacterium]|jgi:tRNA(fMet)-specific endonuclease VapC
MDSEVLLDTDILSALMRRVPNVQAHSTKYLLNYSQFNFSSISRFEILRGLKAKNALKQIASFNVFCINNNVLPLADSIIVRAADIYADLSVRGQLIQDADLLIAATALEHNLVLVTNNTSHFKRVPDLQLDNWLL